MRALPLIAAAVVLAPLGAQVTAHVAARIVTAVGTPIDDGVLLVAGGRITALGPRATIAIPAAAKTIDHGAHWLAPGFVDLHHHVSGGGGDINDMVLPLNAELRTFDVVKPSEEAIRRTVAGGVTTTLFIPGSGTNISGFGTLLKMFPDGPFERMVVRELGAMKVAQGFNPERGSGDMGASRMGSNELLTRQLARARDYAAAWREHRERGGSKPAFEPELEQLRQVFDLTVPVLIHTAGARDCVATSRMFQDVFPVRMVLSHGCFDGWLAAAALAKRQTPLNLGPRMFEFDRYGRMQGMCEAYWNAGCRDLSINTDAPVVAAEELQLQAAMAVRLGLPYTAALQALTIQPARQIGLADRVGSLEVGKDADFQVTAGDPLDPRHAPLEVWIEGTLVHRSGDVR
ncbi:MAG: amidohydrolase family protein [Planctomycetes bacterium]|jgi:imidazolonepropionase-like amidohydrolase|nr:amidohydrolase family protein [Planctomycetota bacterium]